MAAKRFSAMFVALVLVAVMAISVSKVQAQAPAQPNGLSAEGASLGGRIIFASGIVPCGVNATVNGTTPPPFPNANVTVMCLGLVVGTTTTNASGSFTVPFLSLLPITPSNINTCSAIVTTPLAACNASLGNITAPLVSLFHLIGTNLIKDIPVTHISTTAFQLRN